MAKKKKKRRYTRKKRRSGKRRQMGILGKTGIFLIGGVPLTASVIEGAVNAAGRPDTQYSMGDKLVVGFLRTINNLTTGFGMPEAFPTVQGSQLAGRINVGNGWDGATPFLYSAAGGGIMLAADVITGKVTKTSPRIMGVPITGRY